MVCVAVIGVFDFPTLILHVKVWLLLDPFKEDNLPDDIVSVEVWLVPL